MTPHEAVERVIAALRAAGQAHLVTGALASNHYGIERSTKDADIVLETAPGDFAAFAAAARPILPGSPRRHGFPPPKTSSFKKSAGAGSRIWTTR